MATTSNKRKKAVAATVAAAAILLAGTFAWTSISQQAKNEAIVDINPGGRLHDDFNGTNKDVYVENFNSENDATAVPIYARVRLDEYMEIGQEAGMKAENASTPKKADAVKGVGTFGDTSTWQTYKPGTNSLENTANVSDEHWKLSWGNDDKNKYYMPTFDKNKDSLEADVNGTYEGTVEGDIVHYDDYAAYEKEGITETAPEYYDWDSNTLWENGTTANPWTITPGEITDDTLPIDSGNVLKTNPVEHSTKQISTTAEVITMAQWQALDDEQKAAQGYWVYDTDGWAYWSQAIAPGATTGLFLSGIQMDKVPDDNWYYGINVVGQFATAGDLKAFTQGGETMTEAAKDLMVEITELGESLIISGTNMISPGGDAQYSLTMKKAGIDAGAPADAVWSIENVNVPAAAEEGETGTGTEAGDAAESTAYIQIDEKGKVSAAADVPLGTTFEVKAVAGTVEDTIAVEVIDEWIIALTNSTPGTTETVKIDGYDWFVLAKENGKALLQASEPMADQVSLFGYNGEYQLTSYEGNSLDTYLNSNDETVTVAFGSAGETKTLPSFRSGLADMRNYMVETMQYSVAGTPPDEQIDDGIRHIIEYSYLKAKAWIPLATDFTSIDLKKCFNPKLYKPNNNPETDFSYRKVNEEGKEEGVALITDEMLEIMLKNSSEGYILTRTYTDPRYAVETYYGVTAGEAGYVLEKKNGSENHEIYPMFWVTYES